MVSCPSCGKENEESARFCFNCGKPMPSPVTSPLPMKPVPTVRTITPLGQIPPMGGMPMAPMGPMPMPFPQQRPMSPVGSCYYHHDLPSMSICSRCGRAICMSCVKPYQQLVFCPECYWTIGPRSIPQTMQQSQQQSQAQAQRMRGLYLG